MMILKNLTRRSDLDQLFRYVFEKDRQNIHSSERIFISHNYRNQDLKGMIKEFEQNEKNRLIRRKDSILVNHLILSFSPLDNRFLSSEIINDIVKKCIDIKLQKALVCGCEHLDKNSRHVHLIWSTIELETGKSLRMSRTEFRNWKLELDQYQREKYPALSNSLPSHAKPKKIGDKHIEFMQSQKQQVVALIRQAIMKSCSKTEFLAWLSDAYCFPYYRFEKLQGVTYKGKKFRFTTLGLNLNSIDSLNELKKEFINDDSLIFLRKNSFKRQEITLNKHRL